LKFLFPEDILASDIGKVPSLLWFAAIGIFFNENFVTKNNFYTVLAYRSHFFSPVLVSVITKIHRDVSVKSNFLPD